MIPVFEARYYDGLTSNVYSVNAYITPAFIEIKFKNKEKSPVVWKITDVKSDAQLNKKLIQLYYGEYSNEILEFEYSPDLKEVLTQHTLLHAKTRKTFYNLLIENKKYILLLFISLVALGSFCYFVVLPSVSPYIVQQISVKREIQLGNVLYGQLLEDEKVDSTKTALVNEYWNEMGYQSFYPVEITVIHNNEVNAFALPGGKIVIFDSILSTMKSHEELAALLSHEYIHIKNRHSLHSLVSAYSGVLLIDLLFGNAGSTINSIFQNAHSFATLRYSRELEKEADENGMQLMYQHKINPDGMYQLFKRLQTNEKEQGIDNMPEFLTSHPVIKNRLFYSKTFAEKHTITTSNKALETTFEQLKKQDK